MCDPGQSSPSDGGGGGDGREGYRRNVDGDVLGVVLATCWGVAKATEGWHKPVEVRLPSCLRFVCGCMHEWCVCLGPCVKTARTQPYRSLRRVPMGVMNAPKQAICLHQTTDDAGTKTKEGPCTRMAQCFWRGGVIEEIGGRNNGSESWWSVRSSTIFRK